MYCSKSGEEIPGDSKFCNVCGNDIGNSTSINDSVISIKNDPEIVRAALEGAAAVVSAQKGADSEIDEGQISDLQPSQEPHKDKYDLEYKNKIILASIFVVLLLIVIFANVTEDSNIISGGDEDSDGDGIIDSKDECPDTPEGENVDPAGCSESQKDSDGDGVSNKDDECSDTPEGEEVNDEGCSVSQTPGFSFLFSIISLVVVSLLFYKKQG